jgi:hypothetical protein
MSSFYSSSGGGGSGSVNIPELYADPVSPIPESAWILATAGMPGGAPIGLLLSLTYAGPIESYQLSYKTLEGPIIRVLLT